MYACRLYLYAPACLGGALLLRLSAPGRQHRAHDLEHRVGLARLGLRRQLGKVLAMGGILCQLSFLLALEPEILFVVEGRSN